ncbi:MULTISPECIES: MarR family transcriptional regulator [unclassified Bradyrhizobium]|uniref:MarR family winged helix-turn-helix transcriptional regulator n=1 Tax=unclassified Bradyrhizobium TaxID=2631580 RepID=UPI0028EDC351|nr:MULTISPECIES: MarR family transcriptional regulator [unclassified Bradyrhizobium]
MSKFCRNYFIYKLFDGIAGGSDRRLARLNLLLARTILLKMCEAIGFRTTQWAQEIELALAKEFPPVSPRNGADEEAEYRAQTRLWLRLLACTTLIEGELRRRFREEFDFTMPRFDVLAQLDREPSGLVLGELPKRLMVSAGNLTPIVDRLVEDGYITRTPSNLDRRVQIVCMTVEGRKAFRRMAKSHGSWLAELLAGVPAERLDGLIGELDELKGAVKHATQKP